MGEEGVAVSGRADDAASVSGVGAKPPPVRTLTVVLGVLIAVVVVFAVRRVAGDVPHIVAGTVPDDDLAESYVAHPWLAYGHIVPGMVYLLGAPLQLSQRFRTRHYTLHRRLGRVLLGCGLLSGVLAVVLGFVFAWGGRAESWASLVFGAWFLACLVLAFRAIRDGRVRDHRRWMVRAFAVGSGIAMIRVWVGIFTGIQLGVLGMHDETFPIPSTFGIAFWLGLGTHVAVGEWWLRRTPDLDG